MRLTSIFRDKTVLHFSIIIIMLILTSFFIDDYYTSILARAVIFTIFAISLDIAWGYAGILSLGHSVFFGLGAYAYSIIALNGQSTEFIYVGIIVGLITPLLFSLLISAFLFYSNSSLFYIGIVTLSLAVLFEQFALQLYEITGGQNGLTNVPGFPFSENYLLYFLLLILIVVFMLTYKVTNSDLGRLVVSVRDNEERSVFLGYNSSFVKTIVFTLSGTIAGLAGVLYAPFDQFVSPTLLAFTLATQVVVWVAIGGRGKIVGAVIGALIINILSPIFNDQFPYIWQIFLGLTFIIVVILLPKGIYSLFGRNGTKTEKYSLINRNISLNSGEKQDEVLKINDLEVSYGSLVILKGIDLTLRRGELTCIIGPNGAGKSTLINGITGKTNITRGSIFYNHKPIEKLSSQQIVQNGIARTFQATNIISSLSVAENLLLASGKGKLPSFLKRTFNIELPDVVLELLKQSGLDEKLSNIAGELSHGEQQSLELCMVLSLEPKFLLLDEPTAGLTLNERENIGNMLKVLGHKGGLSIVIIEHDLDFVKAIADRVTVLYDGKIAQDGPVEEVTNSELVKEIYLGEKVV
jgi:branched-chain amino acid transport system permease protein